MSSYKALAIGVLIWVVAALPTAHANLERAENLYQQAVERIDRYVDHFRRTFDRRSLAGELERADVELVESIRLFEGRGRVGRSAYALVKLGDVYRYQDRWGESIRVYEKAAAVAVSAEEAKAEIRALLGHARSLLYGKKAASAARPLIERALAKVDRVAEHSVEFDSLELLGQVQIAEGDLVGAADSLNRAFRLETLLEDDKLLFYGYLDRADVYQQLANKCDYERDFQPCLNAVKLARRDYRSALTTATKLGWTGLAQQSEGFLSRLHIREQMIESQRRMHELIAGSQIFSPRRLEDVVSTSGFATGATPQLAGLLAWVESQGGLPAVDDARGAYIRGLFHEMAGRNDQALQLFLRAVDLLETDRRKLHQERGRSSFIEDKVAFYYTAALHLLDRRRYDEAFQLMERSRSRVMSDLISTRKLALATGSERQLYAELLELDSEIARYQSCLFDLRSDQGADAICLSLGGPGQSNEKNRRGVKVVSEPTTAGRPDADALQAGLDQLQGKRKELHKQINDKTPRLAELVSTEPASLQVLQRTLAQDGSELLSYLSLESQLLIWHITPDSVKVRSIFLPRSQLKSKIERIRRSLVDKNARAAE